MKHLFPSPQNARPSFDLVLQLIYCSSYEKMMCCKMGFTAEPLKILSQVICHYCFKHSAGTRKHVEKSQNASKDI